jgi:hypothetical protein
VAGAEVVAGAAVVPLVAGGELVAVAAVVTLVDAADGTGSGSSLVKRTTINTTSRVAIKVPKKMMIL